MRCEMIKCSEYRFSSMTPGKDGKHSVALSLKRLSVHRYEILLRLLWFQDTVSMTLGSP